MINSNHTSKIFVTSIESVGDSDFSKLQNVFLTEKVIYMGYWENGILGLVTGDALGVPVEFKSREELKINPVRDMTGFGTYDVPAGSWSDDSSMALAELASLVELKKSENEKSTESEEDTDFFSGSEPLIDLNDIMRRFAAWIDHGEYTPQGEAFDMGTSCSTAIARFKEGKDVQSCGSTGENSNDNGSLMRILPVCIYLWEKQAASNLSDEETVGWIHQVSALTHAHIRSMVACGIYYFCVREILNNKLSKTEASLPLMDLLQTGVHKAFSFYFSQDNIPSKELYYYNRLRNLQSLADADVSTIFSSGYVVHTITAAFWCLITTTSYRECVLKAVNLGNDTDTTAAVAGGLAGLYYAENQIPGEWLSRIIRIDWIRSLCRQIEIYSNTIQK
jgi:ADP-ribosylglycohydrolase